MKRLDRHDREEIRRRIAETGREKWPTILREFAEARGVSERSVYRATREIREMMVARPRKKRSDSGTVKCVPRDLLYELLAYARVHEASAEDTVKMAGANDRLNGYRIAPSTLSAHRKKLGLSRRQMKGFSLAKTAPNDPKRPWKPWSCSAANQLWQIDGSKLSDFKIEIGDSAITAVGADEKFSKNPRKANHVVLVQVVDYYSDAHIWRAYPGPGETLHVFLDFLYWSFSRNKDTRIPVCGIPERISFDQGSAFSSDRFRGACAKLGMQVRPGRPYHKRARGKVERGFRTLKELLKLHPTGRFESLRELNRWLEEISIYYGNRAHSTTGRKPFEMWREVATGRLREAPSYDFMMRLGYKQDLRKVYGEALHIKVAGEKYSLPADPFMAYLVENRPVMCHYDPDDTSHIYAIHEGEAYHVSRGISYHGVDDYKQYAETGREKLVKLAKSDAMKDQLANYTTMHWAATVENAPATETPLGKKFSEDAEPQEYFTLGEALALLEESGLSYRYLPEIAKKTWSESFDGDRRLSRGEVFALIEKIETIEETPDAASAG